MTEVSSLSKYRKPNGYIVTKDIITGKTNEFWSAQCCHCGLHWQVVPGSGIRRGFCYKCMKITCGEKDCMRCFPFEERLDMIDGGGKVRTHDLSEDEKTQILLKKFGKVPIV